MHCCLRLFYGCVLVLGFTSAQAQTFTGEPVSFASPSLQKSLKAWEVYRIDAASLHEAVKNTPQGDAVSLQMGTHDWVMHLSPSPILAKGYQLRVLTANGVETYTPTEQKAFYGYTSPDNRHVRLTLDDDFVYGFVENDAETWYVEPLRHLDASAAPDLFVVYEKKAVIRDPNTHCAAIEADEAHAPAEKTAEANAETQTVLACFQAQIAIASDFSMFTDYGSVGGVENHNIGVLNNVQSDYTQGSFVHDIQFEIVTQFVVSVAGGDPWTASLDAGTLLNDFRDWGNDGNFGVAYDFASLWTNRNFSGSTIGIAFRGGGCNSFKYNCLQDFTDDADFLRNLQSHELGHNFDCGHDSGGCPGGWIMCPSVSTSSDWSPASISFANAFITSAVNTGCFNACDAEPLLADFDWSPSPVCRTQPVSFENFSSGTITGFSWMFPGGSPSTSTQQNPTVTWANAGTYSVKLTVQGVGGPVSVTKPVMVIGPPTANFSPVVDNLTINFFNTTVNGETYSWSFGDGSFSEETDPTYTYEIGGTYTVVLTAFNSCGSSTRTLVLNTAPTAAFAADEVSGCAPFTVHFANESSSNASNFIWQFPGGTPSGSTAANPVVTYSIPGIYPVTLTATNQSGSNVTEIQDYIFVQDVPTPDFNLMANGSTVDFFNNSSNAVSYQWNFGDGQQSTQANPSHTYAAGGTYTVTLTAINGCGPATTTQTVQVAAAPTASFTASPASGCGSVTVQFTNTSTGNPTAFSWQFPGGTPSTSTVANPVVTYNTPGAYSVTLTASNAAGNNSTTQTNIVTVTALPTVSTVPNQTVCNGAPVSTVFSGTTGAGFTWTNSNTAIGLPAQGSGNLNFLAANVTAVQTATITVTPSLGGCTGAPTTFTVTVNPAPVLSDPADQTVCAGAPINVNFASAPAGASFSWTNTNAATGVPASGTGNLAATAAAVATAQSGTITVTPTLAGCTGAAQTFSVAVNPATTAGFSATVNGATANFTNTSGFATTYAWNFGDGGTGNQANPSHTYAADGVYTVTLTATGACGTATSTQMVTVVTPPTAGFNTSGITTGCGPLTVQFNSTSSVNATTFNWQFPGGTPATSTQPNPVVIYNTPGTYSVTLTAGNAAGNNTSTQTDIVTVQPGPTAGFGATVTGATATFSNTSTNATTYSWNFGDGGSSALASPSHTYANDGTYTVVLTATNACGSGTFTQNVVVITSPNAGFTATTTTGCGPLTVQFNDLSSGNTTGWQWSFPGGSPATSTLENPVVVYNDPGVYDVVLVATSAGGSSTFSQTDFITLLPDPQAAFTPTGGTTTFSFNNTSQYATSYSWNFGDGGASAEASPVHTYTADGVYTVTLTATNNCGSATATATVTVVTPPTAGISAGATSGCAPLTVQFTEASSANATGFAWTFEGATPETSALENPLAIWSQPGVYTVTLIVSNAAGQDTAVSTVTVNTTPTPGYTVQTAGLGIVLTNTSVGATAYSWDFGDGTTSNEANPTHNYAAAGQYTVTLTATNACGSVEFAQQVTITGSAPLPAFTASALEGCAPLTVMLSDQSAGEPAAWSWVFEGGQPAASAEQNPSVVFPSPGVYTVSLTVSNAFGSNTATQEVTVNGLPGVQFDAQAGAGGEVVFTNQSANAIAYTWNFGDGATSQEENPTHVYAANGVYTVELTALNTCGASTLQQTITVVVVGTDSPDWVEHFRLYPNPNSGVFTVELQGRPGPAIQFSLFNAIGQLIRNETAEFGAGILKRSFDYGGLPSGVYSLGIRSGEKVYFVKVVVQQ